MNLIKKLALLLAIATPLSMAPILTSCNSQENVNTTDSEEVVIENIDKLNDLIKADTNKNLQSVGFSFQNYNGNSVLNVYTQEFYDAIYSYKITPDKVEEILIQPESYRYYTVTYILEGVDPNTLDIPLDTVMEISAETKDYLPYAIKIATDGNLEQIVENQLKFNEAIIHL